MTAPNSRVRVRFTPLADGLYLVFFHPADPGDYLVEVFHHYPLPKPNHTKMHHFARALVGTFDVSVVSPGSHAVAATACARGPFAGRWVRLAPAPSCRPPYCQGDIEQAVNSSWVYVPYDCYLSFRYGADVDSCLQGRWVLFHGDSTVEENALGFVKDLLRGDTPMKKQRGGDPWRNFDVLIQPGVGVSHMPPDAEIWANRSAVGRAATRVTMRFNPTPKPNGQAHHQGECLGLRMYTHHCRLTQELLDQFRSGRPPDVLVIGGIQWDLVCVPLKMYKGLLQDIAGLFSALHLLSPGTLFIFRTTYGSMSAYQNHPQFGIANVDLYVEAALDVMCGLPFVRLVDLYDVVKPWAMTGYTGDGVHLSVDAGLLFLHRHVLQLLLHEVCVAPPTG
eukprot:EG_transcript_10290